ncbi:hypothetical protein BKA69DRAFT_425407 [Paraphysoderma sedebokerense]|nr:hypothetical protein BKA69DRAFT_627241 [Paraphysoderma sedebokerense]KAI9141074.1 hypothetical protein BKA69DRAFT_425407 [Paraphysoderma sedebokerense]
MILLRKLLVISVFFLYESVSASVLPAANTPRHKLLPGRSSSKPLLANPHNVPRVKPPRRLPYTFKDVRGVSVQDRNGHLVCAMDPEKTLSPGEKKKPLLDICPFDSNNLEEQGLIFIGWHGNIRKNIDTIQEGITSSSNSSSDSSWFSDGFFCYDSLMVARREAQIQRLRCQQELNNKDDDDSCDYAMCGVFSDKDWWLNNVDKAVISREYVNYWEDPTIQERVLKAFIQDALDYNPNLDIAIAAFSYVYQSGEDMSVKIPSKYTAGLIPVCVPDQIAQKLFDEDLNGLLQTRKSLQRPNIDTVRRFFGGYYEGMKTLRYYETVLNTQEWPAARL